MRVGRIGVRDGSNPDQPDPRLSVAWFYDVDACRGATGVTRHALAQLNCLAQRTDIRFQAVSGRITLSEGLIYWQDLGDLSRRELPLSTPNMLRAMRSLDFPPLDWWTGKVDWVYSPAEYHFATKIAKRALTCHDILQDLRYGTPRRKEFLRHCLDHAHLILSVSEFNTARLLEAFPFCKEKVALVPNAADDLFHEPTPDSDRVRARGDLGLPSGVPYVLSVANFQPRKNLARMIRALGRLDVVRQGELAVVLIGEGDEKFLAEVRDEIGKLGPKALIRLPGYVQGRRLRAIYAESALLCFPSLCESFGIPAAEAMAQGIPVALANDTALPEVAGEAGWYFNPLDEEAIAATVSDILVRSEERERKVEIGRQRSAERRWSASCDLLTAALQARR